MLSYKMDFSFCAWKLGFVKSSHICHIVGEPVQNVCLMPVLTMPSGSITAANSSVRIPTETKGHVSVVNTKYVQ